MRRTCLVAALALALAGCQPPRRPDMPPAPVPATAPEAAARPVAPPRVQPAPTPPPAPAAPDATPPPALDGAALIERWRRGLADPPCVEDRVVQRWERLYARGPERFVANLEAVLPLFALVLDAIEGHRLPTEYALLPLVESWYRPDAGAPRSAYGLWQFTAPTARNFGLRVDDRIDERLAPLAATRAAVRYLATLQNAFGDWKLANMAYNAGEFRLRRVLARTPDLAREVSAARHRPPGLSMTTYEHVAKMQALACLLAEPARFGLTLPRTEVVALRATPAPRGVATLAQAARGAGLDAALVQRLNPVYRRGVPAGAVLLLPVAGGERLHAVSDTRPAAPARAADAPPRLHRVARGDTLGAIARRYRVLLADLLRWNGLDARAPIHPGQRLRLEP